MADAGRNNTNNRNNHNNNYEEPHRNSNTNRRKNRRIRFTNTRRVRPIPKQGKSTSLANRHKTRTKAILHANYPDEHNVLRMMQNSTRNASVAKEIADLFAEHDTYEEMIHALVEKPISAHIKTHVYAKLHRNAANLIAPPPNALVPHVQPARNYIAINTGNMPPGGYTFNDPRYNVSKDPLYQ